MKIQMKLYQVKMYGITFTLTDNDSTYITARRERLGGGKC